MTGIKGNKGHANKTSYPNQKNNKKCPKVILRKFLEMYEKTLNDKNILSFQDSCKSIGWRSTKVDYWVNKLPIFETLKKDMQEIIIARINGEALKGQFNAASSIWRMKQLGEKEKSEQDINLNGTGSIDLSTWLEKEDE